MKVQLSCQPLTWGADFETAAREIAEIGFDGIEAPVANYLERLDELKKLLEQNNLRCSATYTSARFEDDLLRAGSTEQIVKIAAALPQLNCDTIILSAGARPKDESEITPETYERFADGANECARQCFEKYGVKSVFHNHAWTLIESQQEVDTLMDLTDPHLLWAGFDTAQLAYGNYEPAQAFSKWRERIGYVHIKDNHPSLPTAMPISEKNDLRQKGNAGKKSSGKFHVFYPLGEGVMGDAPLDATLDVLREIDYQGWITGELDSCDGTPREGNAHNYQWLQQHLKDGERLAEAGV